RAAGQGVDGAEDLRPVLLVGVDVEEADPRVATVLEVAEHAADEALSAMRTGVVRLAVMTDVLVTQRLGDHTPDHAAELLARAVEAIDTMQRDVVGARCT